MTDYDIGWTAGIIDGEGSVEIIRLQHNAFQARIRVANTCLAMVIRLHDLWGGSVNKVKLRGLGTKEQYCWSVVARQALTVLEFTEPHMSAKRKRAAIAIELQRRVSGRKGQEQGQGWANISEAELTERARLHEQIKLN